MPERRLDCKRRVCSKLVPGQLPGGHQHPHKGAKGSPQGSILREPSQSQAHQGPASSVARKAIGPGAALTLSHQRGHAPSAGSLATGSQTVPSEFVLCHATEVQPHQHTHLRLVALELLSLLED